MKKQTKELVQDITDYLNTFNSKEKEFCEAMSCEHRTLQQSFTRLCFQWIEHCASDEYRIDARNEQSKSISLSVLHCFKEKHRLQNGFTGEALEEVSKPSRWLRTI